MKTRAHTHAFPGPDDTLRRTLPNGITVLARENFASPAVVVNGYVEVGAEDEIPTQAGLSSFTVDVMERGTHKRPFETLYEEVESVGATFGLGSGTHITTFGGKGLSEQLPFLLDVLSDVLRNPAFAPEQVERARAEILTDIRERAHDTRRMATRLFHELTYPESHPYHWSNMGYTETVMPLTRDDLLAFHERFFAPRGGAIIVVGAVKAEEAFEAVRRAFGDWQGSRPARSPLPEVPSLQEVRKEQAFIADKTQSDLQLGWPGPSRDDPDFYACYVANTVLGIFGMMGRLGESVRTASGLAYYAYSSVSGGQDSGPWRAIAGVNPHNVERAVDLIQKEIERLREEPVPQEELEDSQSFLTGRLPLQLETNEGVAHALINIERYGLGLDYLQRYAELIGAVTVEDVQGVAQRWLDPEHYSLAIAGPQLDEAE
ncbi:MAG: M16 family metallopeptidase [Anaerolineales bacterium]